MSSISRGFSSEYSRCLDEDEAKEVVREAHEGICGGHVGYQTLVKQIIRAGYYWKTMQQDCYHFVKKCIQCQIHAPSIHAPATYLQSVVSPWPFSMWAFDVVGPITHLCFKWPQILHCRNRIFHQVGRSYHSPHSRRPTRGLFHSQEHPLPFRHTA